MAANDQLRGEVTDTISDLGSIGNLLSLVNQRIEQVQGSIMIIDANSPTFSSGVGITLTEEMKTGIDRLRFATQVLETGLNNYLTGL